MQATGIAIPESQFPADFLDVSSFQKGTLEMDQELVWTHLKLRFDRDPMRYELVFSPRCKYVRLCWSMRLYKIYSRMRLLFYQLHKLTTRHSSDRQGRILTSLTFAKVSRPLKTKSTFWDTSSSSVILNVVLNAHSASPTPIKQNQHMAEEDPECYVHWISHSWRPTNFDSQFVTWIFRWCIKRLTGSGIFFNLRSSTWTVVGKEDTGSHSLVLLASMVPTTWVKVQSVNSLVVLALISLEFQHLR